MTPHLVDGEPRETFALGASTLRFAERAASGASSAAMPPHSCMPRQRMLNLPHGRANNYALACGELRSPPVRATLSRMLTISEVEPTHVSTLVTFCVRPTDLTLSCAARAACRSLSGAAVAANDVRRTGWRPATGVTPSAGDEVGSSAAGPKPGRISFTPKLAGGVWVTGP